MTAAQVREVAERIIAAGHWRDGDPDILVVFDAGHDLTRLAWLLRDLPVEVLGRLRSDRVMYFPAPPRLPGTNGRPLRHGAAFKLAGPGTWPAPAAATCTQTTRYGTPPSCGAVTGSARSSPSRRAFTRSGSHTDSDKKTCSRCTAGSFNPVTGSAPAKAVSVLFRSRGTSSPARYSRNPRRCATCVKRSSNRAAYSSSGPGAVGHAIGLVIAHHRLPNAPGKWFPGYLSSLDSTEPTGSRSARSD